MENDILNTEEQKNTIDRKEFMRQVGISFGAIMLMNCVQGCSSGNDIPDPVTPTTTGKVDFTLDLTKSDYSKLNTIGGFLVINAQNVIVARVSESVWLAVDSRCTHEQNVVSVYRAATNDFVCPTHNSVFSSTGAVVSGPATKALTKYNTAHDATNKTVRIFA